MENFRDSQWYIHYILYIVTCAGVDAGDAELDRRAVPAVQSAAAALVQSTA